MLWRMVESELSTHALPPTANLGASARAKFRRFLRGNGEGMVFASNIVRALLSVRSQISVGQMVAGQALVSRDSKAFENCQRGTWKSTHVDLVWSQTRPRADRIVVGELNVRELQISVVLEFVDDHSQHLGHGVVHPFNASVVVWMVGYCGKFMDTQTLKNIL